MEIISSRQLWQQKQLNQSGIRRFKVADARSILLVQDTLVPIGNLEFFEFIFPADLSCIANFQQQVTESGSVFWKQSISFSLPHLNDEMVMWAHDHPNVLWVAIAEDYNFQCRLFGGSPEGLQMGFQATTGGAPKDANPMNLIFAADQLLPYTILPAYEDKVLFPDGGFSYGFSTGFNS